MGCLARCALALAFVSSATVAAFDPSSILTKHLGFTHDDITKIERGELVAHTLAADPSELAVAGATLVRVPIAFYLERFEQIESFKKGDEVLQIARIPSSPSAADFQSLTFDEGDLEALRECQVGDCSVKLDATGIETVKKAADTASAFRTYLAGYTGRYLREGNAALMKYDDGRKQPMDAGLRAIMARSPYLQKDWPLVTGAIRDFNGSMPSDLRQFVYWSKEKPPGKSIVSLTHAIVRPERNGVALAATKQFYASHYVTASLGLTVLINRDSAAGPRTLVIYINRTHLDLFDGMLGRLKRPIVRSRARSLVERSLTKLSRRLEADWASRSSGVTRND